MRYYYEKPEEWISAGKIYLCNHPMYNRCTLFQNGSDGLAIIQERFNEITKVRWWSSIDPWLAGDIYFHENFQKIFSEYASKCDENGLYPTITIRKIMWILRMKPLKKESWENNYESLLR